MRIKGRFEVQEREDLEHLSVVGHIEAHFDERICHELWIDSIDIAPEDHDRFLKLVLTVLFNEENHFDFIILDKSPQLPGLIQIWPGHLFEYFDVPKIND